MSVINYRPKGRKRFRFDPGWIEIGKEAYKTGSQIYQEYKKHQSQKDKQHNVVQSRRNKGHSVGNLIAVPSGSEKVITHTYTKVLNKNAAYWRKYHRIGASRYMCFSNSSVQFKGTTEGKQHVDQISNLYIAPLQQMYTDWMTSLATVTAAQEPAGSKYTQGRELFLDKIITRVEIVNNTEYSQEVKVFSFVCKVDQISMDLNHDMTNPKNTWATLLNNSQGNAAATTYTVIGEMPYQCVGWGRWFKTNGYSRLFIPPGGVVSFWDIRNYKMFIDTDELTIAYTAANIEGTYGAYKYVTGGIMMIARGLPAHDAAGAVSTPVGNLDVVWIQKRYYGEVDKEKHPYFSYGTDTLAADKDLSAAVDPEIRVVDD